MIVGHLPFLADLASVLIADDESAETVTLPTVAVLCLERTEPRNWRVCWMMIPELLP